MIKEVSNISSKVSHTSKPIKVLINANTIITIKDKNRFEFWLAKYPEAKIIN